MPSIRNTHLQWTVVGVFGVVSSLVLVWLNGGDGAAILNAIAAVLCAYGLGRHVADK